MSPSLRMLTRAVAIAAALFFTHAAQAQTNAATTNGSVKITTGNTFQQLFAAVPTPPVAAPLSDNPEQQCVRRLLSYFRQQRDGHGRDHDAIEHDPGQSPGASALTAQQAAIVLAAGIPYQRYYPAVPSDAFYVTCATTGDSVYVDTQ